jgi:tartrate dehydratase beta subunit/fumarate hydratase class I family protein
MLTREQILAVQDITQETVEVPEWGGSVYVRGMTGTERDAFEQKILVQKGKKREANMDMFRAKLIAYSVCDEKGELLFAEEDIEALGKKSASALQRIFDVAMRLSGLSPDDAEELTKN